MQPILKRYLYRVIKNNDMCSDTLLFDRTKNGKKSKGGFKLVVLTVLLRQLHNIRTSETVPNNQRLPA